MSEPVTESPLWWIGLGVRHQKLLSDLRIDTIEKFLARVSDPAEREAMAKYLGVDGSMMQQLFDAAVLAVDAPKDPPRKVAFGALPPPGWKMPKEKT